ncbi:hypothetical protein [Rhodococcoides kroppenstedtii]|uniref:hypothetical protein n=1 Tax=Rhodococcoides kroppenstedtii TaxID=293050 RepID=UPI00362B9D2B
MGARVTVTLTDADPGSGGPTTSPGVVVEDFGDEVLSGDELGRDWGLARRLAVALDSGRLVFVDTTNLAPIRT